ncbi:MAG: DNA-binding domain-containing protein [Parvularculaceae bacterium]
MPDLAAIQQQFRDWLLDHDAAARAPAPAFRRDGDDPPVQAGFAVYRNNVHHSLTKALRETFPAVEALAGPEFFNYLSHEYIAAHPPVEPRLREFARRLPEFVSGFPPCKEHPYFADVARLELAWLDAYHAAEASPLSPEALAGIDPERVAALRLRPHPSLELLQSAYPVDEIWRRVKAGAALGDVDMGAGRRLAIARPGAEVAVEPLGIGEFELLGAIAEGAPLGAAHERAIAAAPDFDLAAALANSLNHGFVVAFDFAETS